MILNEWIIWSYRNDDEEENSATKMNSNVLMVIVFSKNGRLSWEAVFVWPSKLSTLAFFEAIFVTRLFWRLLGTRTTFVYSTTSFAHQRVSQCVLCPESGRSQTALPIRMAIEKRRLMTRFTASTWRAESMDPFECSTYYQYYSAENLPELS